jgi:uncharacterized membrane protein
LSQHPTSLQSSCRRAAASLCSAERARPFVTTARTQASHQLGGVHGLKGFAWVGGFALFLGVAFFIKYSFDNNLVPPQLRVAIGFLAGLGLLVGGVLLSRKNFPALSQTLCATGIVVLYAVTFASPLDLPF